jgi:transposase
LLELDRFWQERLGELRGEVPWEKVAELLAVNRLCAPGSELSIHERWYAKSGMDILLGCGEAVAEKDRLYRCLDRLVSHKAALESHLKQKWGELFEAEYEVLLYDLTSTYFEGQAVGVSKAKRGYSRDHRPDCKQLVIALIVTPEGFPLSYEIFDGNLRDVKSLEQMLAQVERKYGQTRRTWVFDRGVVSEDNLKKIRERGGTYIVGTRRSQLGEFEKELPDKDWQKVRPQVEVKLRRGADGDIYVMARSGKRRAKENAMKRKPLRKLYESLKKLSVAIEKGRIGRYEIFLKKLGRLQERYTPVFGFMKLEYEHEHKRIKKFSFRLQRQALKQAYRRDGIYLLRTNLTGTDPKRLWEQYIQLTEVESAFRALKSEVGLRPIYHWVEPRVEAHVMVAFMAYALWVGLKWKLKSIAGSLTPRQVLQLFESIQLVDVWFDTVDNRRLCLPRITTPLPEHQLILDQLKWRIPEQPPPRIYAPKEGLNKNVVETRG